MIDSSINGCSFFLWLFFPCMVFLYMVRMYWVPLITCFSPLILLHASSQVTINFTSFSENSVLLLSIKCLPSNASKSLRENVVVTNLQTSILLVTRRVVLLGHCILPRAQIFPQNPKKIWSIIMLRSRVLQNLLLPSNVNMLPRFSRILCLKSTWKHPIWLSHQNSRYWTWQHPQRNHWCKS